MSTQGQCLPSSRVHVTQLLYGHNYTRRHEAVKRKDPWTVITCCHGRQSTTQKAGITTSILASSAALQMVQTEMSQQQLDGLP